MAADLEDKRYIEWPWTVGGSNDGYAVDPECFATGGAFRMLKSVPQKEDERIDDEIYTPRRVEMPGSNLVVRFFAASDVPEGEAGKLIWERLCERVMHKSLTEQLDELAFPDVDEVIQALGSPEPTPGPHGMSLLSTQMLRKTSHILKLIPRCPKCKAWLIMRDPTRRFTEDDNYAECRNGHVFVLAAPSPGGEDVQHRIAGLFLEGRLFAGAPTEHGYEFTKIEQEG